MKEHKEHTCDFVTADGIPENAECVICKKSILADVVLPPAPEEKPITFSKYRSIHSISTETDKEIFKKLIKDHGFDSCAWVVINKYHGENLQVLANAEEVQFATRETIITPANNPTGLFSLTARVDYLTRIVKELQMFYGYNVSLFFEYFGGRYPHPNVPPANPELHRRVQKGVFYCPHNDIRLIDIKINEVYLEYDEFKEVANRFNIRIAHELMRGSFYQCLEFDPVFEDPTYKDYKLPRLENNFSEGVVLRPVKNFFFRNGRRCMLKNKHPKFREKQKAPRVMRKPKAIPAEITTMVEELSKNITENRLNNILSHNVVKLDSHKAIPELVGLMIQDIFKEDLIAESIPAEQVKDVQRILSRIVAEFIKPIIVPKIKKEIWRE